LATPATSAPAKRLFIIAGQTTSNEGACFLPENTEKLLFLRENWGKVEAFIQKEQK
jgi:hypothetical protein